MDQSRYIGFVPFFKLLYGIQSSIRKGTTEVEEGITGVIHLRSFKTPPSSEARAVMSDEDDADCAVSMRKGVKNKVG